MLFRLIFVFVVSSSDHHLSMEGAVSALFSGQSEAEQQCVKGRKRKRESEAGISMQYQSPGQHHRISWSLPTIAPFPAGYVWKALIFDGCAPARRVLCVPPCVHGSLLGKCAQTVSVMVYDRFHRLNSRCCHMVDGFLGPKRFLCGHESDHCSFLVKSVVTSSKIVLDQLHRNNHFGCPKHMAEDDCPSAANGEASLEGVNSQQCEVMYN